MHINYDEIMIKQTSIDSYHTIKQNGLLSSLRFRVYECIAFNGPMTVSEALLLLDSGESRNTGSFTGRFSELERMGVIRTIGTRPCKVTDNNCEQYVVTNELPKKLPKLKTRSERVYEVIEAIEDLKTRAIQLEPIELQIELSNIIDLLNKL